MYELFNFLFCDLDKVFAFSIINLIKIIGSKKIDVLIIIHFNSYKPESE